MESDSGEANTYYSIPLLMRR